MAATGDEPICLHCGQCANVCPVDSITERSEWNKVAAAVKDPHKVVIVSTSPSVRVGLGEEFGMEYGSFKEFYGEPLSELAEQMLHTVYTDRSGDLHKD